MQPRHDLGDWTLVRALDYYRQEIIRGQCQRYGNVDLGILHHRLFLDRCVEAWVSAEAGGHCLDQEVSERQPRNLFAQVSGVCEDPFGIYFRHRSNVRGGLNSRQGAVGHHALNASQRNAPRDWDTVDLIRWTWFARSHVRVLAITRRAASTMWRALG